MPNRNGTGEYRPSLRNETVTQYRAMLEELDHAWAQMTDTERAELADEEKRRRAANPNWPFLNSDHADRLIERIKKNTDAVTKLEEAIDGPDGMTLRMRASTSAIDMMRETIERKIESNEKVLESNERLINAIETLAQVMSGAHV